MPARKAISLIARSLTCANLTNVRPRVVFPHSPYKIRATSCKYVNDVSTKFPYSGAELPGMSQESSLDTIPMYRGLSTMVSHVISFEALSDNTGISRIVILVHRRSLDCVPRWVESRISCPRNTPLARPSSPIRLKSAIVSLQLVSRKD